MSVVFESLLDVAGRVEDDVCRPRWRLWFPAPGQMNKRPSITDFQQHVVAYLETVR